MPAVRIIPTLDEIEDHRRGFALGLEAMKREQLAVVDRCYRNGSARNLRMRTPTVVCGLRLTLTASMANVL